MIRKSDLMIDAGRRKYHGGDVKLGMKLNLVVAGKWYQDLHDHI
jgi:hypothetical protein